MFTLTKQQDGADGLGSHGSKGGCGSNENRCESHETSHEIYNERVLTKIVQLLEYEKRKRYAVHNIQSSQLSRIGFMTHTLTHNTINLTQCSLTIKVPPLIHIGLCDVYFSLVINSVWERPGQLNAYLSMSSIDSTGEVEASSRGGVADQVVALH